ncbi:MAG: amino acid adenylation domain-containing protein, partial [Polyangiaceae bacterium]
MPTDRPRPVVKTYASRRVDIVFPSSLVDALRKVGARAGCSLFVTLLSGFEVLMYRLTGQDDLLVGIPVAGQSVASSPDLVGHCVSTLPMRARLVSDEPFLALMKAQRSTVLDGFEHQACTLGGLLRRLPITRDPSRLPLVSILFNLDQPVPPDTLRWEGVEVDLQANPRRFENFELFVNAVENDGGLVLECQYNTDLFDEESVRHWFDSFRTLLERVATNPDTPIGILPVLGPSDVALLQRVNATHADLAGDVCAHELIEAQVDRTPDAVAVECGQVALSYRQLEERANRLAHRLRAHGVSSDTLVGLSVERSADMVVALFAVLKAGGAYVPLDPAFPEDRIAFMVSDARLRVVITQRSLQASLQCPDAVIVCVDDESLASDSSTRPSRLAEQTDLAYVIYTSGSTGRPKGVELPHRAVVNFLSSVAREPGIGPSDALLAVTTLSFDIAVLELYLPLTVGARVVIASQETTGDGRALLAELRRRGATMMQATPSTWRLLLAAGWSRDDPMKVLCGGEALPLDLARELVQRSSSVWNMYGPTETTVWSSVYRLPEDVEHIVIGHPIANTEFVVLDASMQPVPTGVRGELYIAGDGLARGYLRRPDLTTDRFVPDSRKPGHRLYRTGDVARLRRDGNFEYFGRNDQQVKLRGYRIELGEIESVVASHPGVAQAVTAVREVKQGDVRLVVYVVPKAGAVPAVGAEDLRGHARASLPDYMVPQHIVLLSALPLTPNGKVDRKALPPPVPVLEDEGAHVAPRTVTERMIAEIWQEALSVGRLGVHDDFFRLGGHSLLAAQVLSRLARDHGVALSLRRIFEAPTVAQLAAVVDAESRSVHSSVARIPRRLGPGPARQSVMQQRIWLMEQLQPGLNVYNLPSAYRLRGAVDVVALERSLVAIVGRHEVLRTTLDFDGEEAVQRVAPSLNVDVVQVDLSDRPPARRESELLELLQQAADAPFDLRRGPLFRATLYRLDAGEHALFFMPHHAIWDGWSFDIFMRELDACYAAMSKGSVPDLPPLPIQYADFSEWHLRWLDGDEMARQAAYWKAKLGSEVTPLEMPTDRPRPPAATGSGAFEPLRLSPVELESLERVARDAGVTLYMLTLAAFLAMLHRYTGQDDLLVGTPVRGRTQPETEDLLGFFVNTLVIRGDLSGSPTFRHLLERVRATCLEAFAHPDMPFEQLVRELNVPRDLSRTPIFQSFFSFQDATARKDSIGDLEIAQIHLMPQAAQTDITMWVMHRTTGLFGGVSYSTDLFDAETVRRFLREFYALLASVARDVDQRVAAIPIVPERETRQLEAWNETEEEYERERRVDEVVEAQAGKTPDAVAVEDESGGVLSYG